MIKLVSFVALFSAGSAFAAPASNPEFLHQAPVGAIELTPTLSYQQVKFKLKNGGSDIDVKGLREAVQFEYGLSEMVSAGLVVANHSLKTSSSGSSDTTDSGLEDLEIFMRGRADSPTGSLRYGLGALFALEKEKIEANGDSNSASGGISLTPFLGYETAIGQGILGARVSYKLLVADRKGETTNSSGTKTSFTTTGGNALETSVFYEMPLPSGVLGFAYQMAFTDKTKVEANGNKTDRTTSNTVWNLAAYVPIDVTPTIRILPALAYGQFGAFDTTGVDSVEFWRLDVGARFTF